MCHVGDKICVNPLPAKDIYGVSYNETGSGGTVIAIENNNIIVALFDGFIIKVPNEDYDKY